MADDYEQLVVNIPGAGYEYRFNIPPYNEIDIEFFLDKKGGSERTNLGKIIIFIPGPNDQVWLLRDGSLIREVGNTEK